jgi:3-isopropylmalate/(R)-2-methylmalate dehydratase large subunit
LQALAETMSKTLYDKLWDSHVVHVEDDGTALLYIDRHLVHEVTSPQAFEGLKLAGRKPWRVSSIVATADHNTPTDHWEEGIKDPISRQQVETLDANIREVGALAYFPFKDQKAGHRPRGRPGKRRHAARHDRGLRRLAYLDAWRLCLPGARHRHLGSRACAGDAVPAAEEVEDHAGQGRGQSRRRRHGEGHRAGPDRHIGTAGGTATPSNSAVAAIRALSMEGRMTVCNMAIEAAPGSASSPSTTRPSPT